MQTSGRWRGERDTKGRRDAEDDTAAAEVAVNNFHAEEDVFARAAGIADAKLHVAAAELKSPTLIFVGSVVSLLNKRDDAAAFGDALTEIKTRAAPVRVLTADGAQALLASVGAREGAADERDSRVEVM